MSLMFVTLRCRSEAKASKGGGEDHPRPHPSRLAAMGGPHLRMTRVRRL
jgi:hypothetical protein